MGVAAVPNYIIEKMDKSLPPGHRFGLFFPVWRKGTWQMENKEGGKTEALKTVLHIEKDVRDMARAAIRRQRYAGSALGDSAFSLFAKSTSPFMTGVGMEHPIENGFAFLNPYGIPYLPGGSVKGVLKKAAEDLALDIYGDTDGWSVLDVWWLFGFEAGSSYLVGERGEKVKTLKDKADTRKEAYIAWARDLNPDQTSGLLKPFIGQACQRKEDRERYIAAPSLFLEELTSEKSLRESIHNRGSLTLWDVFPEVAGDQLSIDILTPHYGKYYEGGSSPADCGQPVPSPFLTVPPGSLFEFHVQYAPVGVLEGLYDNRWKALLQAAFEHAFTWMGFGAKTSVGYGQMEPDSEARQRVEKERAQMVEQEIQSAEAERLRKEEERRKAELEAMSPEERDIALLSDPSVTEDQVVQLFMRLDQFSEPNRKMGASALKAYWIKAGKWAKKDCSKKQWVKVQKIKAILGEESRDR